MSVHVLVKGGHAWIFSPVGGNFNGCVVFVRGTDDFRDPAEQPRLLGVEAARNLWRKLRREGYQELIKTGYLDASGDCKFCTGGKHPIYGQPGIPDGCPFEWHCNECPVGRYLWRKLDFIVDGIKFEK